MIDRNDEALNYVDDPKAVIIAALIERDGDECAYCDEPFDPDPNDKHGRTIDHYHSVHFGRTHGWTFIDIHGMGNLTLAGKSCNSRKSNRAWRDDGTLEPRGREQKVYIPKTEVCDTCNSGRNLYPGEFCHICGIGARPEIAPSMLQRRPNECDHDTTHCYLCFIGHIPRKRAMEDVFGFDPDDN